MRLLLDTHIWIWHLGEQHKLSRRVAAALERHGTELWVSPVSSWEIITLAGKGRFKARPTMSAWLEAAWKDKPFHEAPFTQAVALALCQIHIPHRDPADQLLAATARALDLTLVTADTNLQSGKGYKVLAND
jgi:PIN domain nuclease of toxin-antitoxin system